MEVQFVQFKCTACGTLGVVNWEQFQETFWAEVNSCDCCGTFVTVVGDLTCGSCGNTENLKVYNG